MRHDFGFVRAGAARLQRRERARWRAQFQVRNRLSRRLAFCVGATAFALIPGRALFSMVLG